LAPILLAISGAARSAIGTGQKEPDVATSANL
jgi:hypothetical protein